MNMPKPEIVRTIHVLSTPITRANICGREKDRIEHRAHDHTYQIQREKFGVGDESRTDSKVENRTLSSLCSPAKVLSLSNCRRAGESDDEDLTAEVE